jgi:hypothetical protein
VTVSVSLETSGNREEACLVITLIGKSKRPGQRMIGKYN